MQKVDYATDFANRFLEILKIPEPYSDIKFIDGKFEAIYTPAVAKFAYRHVLFSPIDDPVRIYGSDNYHMIPDEITKIYEAFNGSRHHAGAISLHGIYNPKYSGFEQPLYLDSINGSEAPKGFNDELFAFLSVWTSQTTVGTIYVDRSTGITHLCYDKTSIAPSASWSRATEALYSIFNSAETFFDPLSQGITDQIDFNGFMGSLADSSTA